MRKLTTLITLLLVSGMAMSQAHSKGKINIDLGGGLGIYTYDYLHSYKGVTLDERSADTSYAGTTFGYITAEYGVLDWLSIGVNFTGGSYIEEDNDSENNFRTIDLSTKFYFMNRDRFTFFGSLQYGSTVLNHDRDYSIPPIFTWVEKIKHTAPHFSIGLGLKKYFNDYVGLNFSWSYNSYDFNVKEYYVNGDSQDLTDRVLNLNVSGSELRLGLSLKF